MEQSHLFKKRCCIWLICAMQVTDLAGNMQHNMQVVLKQHAHPCRASHRCHHNIAMVIAGQVSALVKDRAAAKDLGAFAKHLEELDATPQQVSFQQQPWPALACLHPCPLFACLFFCLSTRPRHCPRVRESCS